MAEILELKNVSKIAGTETGTALQILDNVNLSIELQAGKIYSLAAPLGAGKTTLLKIISGIDKVDSGEILYKGKKSEQYFPYIPERSSSLPWLTVEENIKYIPGIKRKPSEVIAAVGLAGYEDFIPNEKSTGFRFRISLARALALSPSLILLDDCLKNTDQETKNELTDLIKNISSEYTVTFLYATSNITDALNLAPVVYLMKKNPGTIIKEYSSSGNVFNDIKFIEEILEKENLLNTATFSI